MMWGRALMARSGLSGMGATDYEAPARGVKATTPPASRGRAAGRRRRENDSGGADRCLHLRQRGGVDLGHAMVALGVRGRLLEDLLLRLAAGLDGAAGEQLTASQYFCHHGLLAIIRERPWPAP